MAVASTRVQTVEIKVEEFHKCVGKALNVRCGLDVGMTKRRIKSIKAEMVIIVESPFC